MATKAQVSAKYKAAGIMQPTHKMSADELQAHLNRRSATFASAKGKAARCRATTKRKAVSNW